MDETTRGIINRITIKFPQPSRIWTGQVCTTYFDCFQLSPNDLARLAAEAVGHLDKDTFDVAVGVAYSGILFAAAIAGGELVGILREDGTLYGPDVKNKRVVVVDDVVHRGKRIGEAAEKVIGEGGKIVGMACIVDRSEGKFDFNGIPLWSAYQTGME